MAYFVTTDPKVVRPAAKSGQETVSYHACNDQSDIFNEEEHENTAVEDYHNYSVCE